jgi:hypothetical protein
MHFPLPCEDIRCDDLVTDEILYHARIHPEHRAHALSTDQLQQLHYWIAEVCRVAVSVDADDARFPEDWLFKHRWVSRVIVFRFPHSCLFRARARAKPKAPDFYW